VTATVIRGFIRKGEALVHHTPSFAGTHRFSACDRSAFDAMLADERDGAGRTIVVQRIDAETAREQVAKLVGAFA
jgi:uncharacterized ParB-like nuclease family protein